MRLSPTVRLMRYPFALPLRECGLDNRLVLLRDGVRRGWSALLLAVYLFPAFRSLGPLFPVFLPTPPASGAHPPTLS